MYEVGSHVRSVSDTDGMTILDLESNKILALNSTGAFIWERLQRNNSFQEIVEDLAVATGADKREIDNDTREFIQDLVQRGLLLTNC